MLNLLRELPENLLEESVSKLVENGPMRLERIVSHGHASPEGFWYDQAEDEWVLVLKGAAALEFEHGLLQMRPGDCVNIPAHCRHRVAWTTPEEPTVWLALFYPAEGGPTNAEKSPQETTHQ